MLKAEYSNKFTATMDPVSGEVLITFEIILPFHESTFENGIPETDNATVARIIFTEQSFRDLRRVIDNVIKKTESARTVIKNPPTE